MKKQFVTLFICLLSMAAFGQVKNQHAIGGRLGAGNTFGSQVSYQYGLSNYNRIEVDLGFNSNSDGNGFILSGVYQWVWAIESGFNWYAGPAASLGSWSYKNSYNGNGDSGAYLGIGGQIGAEYNFEEVPINLSLDTMPQIGFGPTDENFTMGLSIGVRYTF
ncbi:MAG: porin family protein [Bacteroidales bacterium]|nr:porin family protein [Bacteroidales bacterium]